MYKEDEKEKMCNSQIQGKFGEVRDSISPIFAKVKRGDIKHDKDLKKGVQDYPVGIKESQKSNSESERADFDFFNNEEVKEVRINNKGRESIKLGSLSHGQSFAKKEDRKRDQK